MIKRNISTLFKISFVSLVLLLIYFAFSSRKAFYPDQQIQSVSKQYLSYFEKSAKQVEKSLFDLRSTIDTLDLNRISQKDYINILISKLNLNSQLSAVLVLEHGKKISMLEKDQATYLFAVDSSKITDVVKWQRLDKEQNVKNTWDRALGVDLNVLDWGEEVFNDSYKYQIPIWTSVGRILENTNRSTASHITWKSEKNGMMLTCIVIINNMIDSKLFPQNGGLKAQRFILNVNSQIFPISGMSGIDSITEKFRKTSISSWKVTGESMSSIFNFSFDESNYWGCSLETNIQGIKSLIIVVEENMLRLSLLSDNMVMIVIIVILVLITIILFVLKVFNKPSSGAIEKYIDSHLSDQHASELIKLGENNHLEFKSSFRFDYKEDKVNKELEYVIAKSIAAFSNANGGTLLIGVDDEGKILGLEKDIFTLKRKDIDFFENFLRTFLNNVFSISFVTNNLRMKFPVVERKIICRIDVEPAQKPIFVEIVKNNIKSERFYVRSGNTSIEIKTLSEINTYIQERF